MATPSSKSGDPGGRELTPVADLAQRALPHNADAERTVLGAVLVDNAAFNSAAEILARDDFHREAHRRIFDAMAGLAEKSRPIDPVTLKDELARAATLEAVGGAAYLAGLMDGVPRVSNVEQWCRIIKEKAVLRQLIHAGNRIVQSAYDSEQGAAELLDQAEKAIFDIAERRVREGFVPIREVVKTSFRTIDQIYQSKGGLTGLATGFVDLDEKTSGLQNGDLIIVAARPAMGKTSLCLNMAQNASHLAGDSVAVFSLEMSKEQLVLRLLFSDARVDSHRLRTGSINEKDWSRLAKAYADLSASKVFIDDSSSLTPLEMRAKCRRLKAEHGLGLVIVDYMQLMSSGGRVENRQQEISSISRSLKGLAKELRVPVVALSQLSRAPEARTDRRPQLSDLRECVTGDTLVLLTDGSRLRIRDLVGRTPDVWSLSADRRIAAASTDAVWRVGRRPVFDIHLASGRRLRATARHRLLGARGWVRVEALHRGDRLAVARCIPEPAQPVRWPDARLALLGHLIGDGSYVKHQPMHFQFAPSRAMLGEYAELLHDEALRSYTTDDVFWDRVVGVEPAGDEEVYDLTVPGSASWLADGIVSHNSGAIEQDADVVMFIYREEEHKPTDENRGMAELIIAKQRNGPTGSIKLAFFKEFTRFENLERQWQ